MDCVHATIPADVQRDDDLKAGAKKEFRGSPTEFAQVCSDNSNNPKAALIAFLKGNLPSATDDECRDNADALAQASIDAFDDLLGPSVGFYDVTDAAYGVALEIAAFGIEWFATAMAKSGHLTSGQKVGEKIKTALPAFDPPRVVVNNTILVMTSEHKFGAYPTCAILLSDDHVVAADQCRDVFKRDRELDSCIGVWKYKMLALDLGKAVLKASG